MSLSRRSFLERAGAAGVVYRLVSGAKGVGQVARPVSANDQIGLGFIGVGIQGHNLFQALRRIPGVRPVAMADVYDGHHARAKEIEPEIFTTRDYHQVLARKDVDAVVIATPDHWHRQMTLDALAAGKDVYCEKPMTWSIPQGIEIMAAEKKSGRILQIGSGAKTSALTAKAREIIQSGALGRVSMVRMANNRNSPGGAWVYPVPADASPETIDWQRFLGPAPKRAYDPNVFFRWRCWWEYSGGVATDLFVHLLTTLHEFMNVTAPRSVVSQGALVRWKDGRTVPDMMESIFEYPEGFVAGLYVNLANSRLLHGTVVMGTEGTLLLGGRGPQSSELTVYPEPVPAAAQVGEVRHWPETQRTQYFESLGYNADGTPREARPPAKAEQVIPVESGPSHFEYFIQSVRDRSPSREDGAAGHYAAAAAHLANMAYRKARRVEWDYRTGKVKP